MSAFCLFMALLVAPTLFLEWRNASPRAALVRSVWFAASATGFAYFMGWLR